MAKGLNEAAQEILRLMVQWGMGRVQWQRQAGRVMIPKLLGGSKCLFVLKEAHGRCYHHHFMERKN